MPPSFISSAVDVGKCFLSTLMKVGQPLVIKAEEMEDGGMEIPNGLWLVHNAVSVFVRGAVNRSGLDAGAS